MPTLKELLQPIANKDVEVLSVKDAEYGSSWKKRGGVGAFMMLARKWDRLETQMTCEVMQPFQNSFAPVTLYDIFARIETNNPKDGESVLETLRDLRRYCLLVEGEIENRRRVDKHYGTGPLQLEMEPDGYTGMADKTGEYVIDRDALDRIDDIGRRVIKALERQSLIAAQARGSMWSSTSKPLVKMQDVLTALEQLKLPCS